ncbi:DUF6705 family protein [Chryseobacterium sp. CFBP8996]|uniref:DUF6705 family protein n=1 Tax=Chryseobacterium sp. CFBP8996 TaxID=3096529 RepID=UPI002A6ADBD5|nr:DUF6705 family protein [Chryseobacterium sp. CFBP8996]MDY0930821.1 DUF6705 family protein [Chryseobacterium sp. CFBP8996]
MKAAFFKYLVLSNLIITISCKSQTLPLNTLMDDIPQGAYVKDLNNELNPYIGTYKTNYNGNEIILFINKVEHKFEKRTNKDYFVDVLNVKYTVKNSSGLILQDTSNGNSSNIELYSIRVRSSANSVVFYYSGTNCKVGWGSIVLKKLNSTQLSWEYNPNSRILDEATCPSGTDTTVYLPVTEGLVFTKQ